MHPRRSSAVSSSRRSGELTFVITSVLPTLRSSASSSFVRALLQDDGRRRRAAVEPGATPCHHVGQLQIRITQS